MDREQAEVYQLLADVCMKIVLACVGALVFFIFAIVLVFNPSWPIAAAQGLLTLTVGAMYAHFFPSRNGSESLPSGESDDPDPSGQ